MVLIDDFRLAMRRLASGVSIVTAVAADGAQCGLTATSVFSLSLHPPALVVGVNKESRLGQAAHDLSCFGVSILGTGHRHIAEAFSGKVSGLKGTTRFVYGKWRYSSEGVPMLDDAPASFICKIDDVFEWSTHLLLIGSVTDVYLADSDTALLVYFSQRFTALSSGTDGPGTTLAR
jgi:flavin reductase (DIM6/NTAB) family NADH-FMN oxidoreductase RutF